MTPRIMLILRSTLCPASFLMNQNIAIATMILAQAMLVKTMLAKTTPAKRTQAQTTLAKPMSTRTMLVNMTLLRKSLLSKPYPSEAGSSHDESRERKLADSILGTEITRKMLSKK